MILFLCIVSFPINFHTYNSISINNSSSVPPSDWESHGSVYWDSSISWISWLVLLECSVERVSFFWQPFLPPPLLHFRVCNFISLQLASQSCSWISFSAGNRKHCCCSPGLAPEHFLSCCQWALPLTTGAPFSLICGTCQTQMSLSIRDSFWTCYVREGCGTSGGAANKGKQQRQSSLFPLFYICYFIILLMALQYKDILEYVSIEVFSSDATGKFCHNFTEIWCWFFNARYQNEFWGLPALSGGCNTASRTVCKSTRNRFSPLSSNKALS